MLRPAAGAHPRAARYSALSDAVAPIAASLLVPLLVFFALEVPADAIDRIASPFVGGDRAPALRQQPTSETEWTLAHPADLTAWSPSDHAFGVNARTRAIERGSAISVLRLERAEPATSKLDVTPDRTADSTAGAPPHVTEPASGAPSENEGTRDPQAPADDAATTSGIAPAVTGGPGAPRAPSGTADEPQAPSSAQGSEDSGAAASGAPAAGAEAPTSELSAGTTDDEAPAPTLSETVTSSPNVPASSGAAPAPALAQPGGDDLPPAVSPADPPGDVGEARPKRRGNSEHAPGHDPAGPGNSEHAPGHTGHGRGHGNGGGGQ